MRDATKDLQRYLDSFTPPMTQTAFGEAVGASQPTVWRWLNGRGKPTIEVALKIELLTKIPAEAWRKEWASLRRRVA